MWYKSAPSNIALIKYMGKSEGNRPTNASLSITLENLRTFVQVEKSDGPEDRWERLVSTPQGDALLPLELTEVGSKKFLGHARRIKDMFGINQTFVIRSANNFPADCGIASSASSFTTLTWAMADACADLSGMPKITLAELSKISRIGSGSSCRSFYK
jgi:diphosphomevalonate decarboxylase